MSCIYHALKPNQAKRVFRVIDHCSVFLLIAGTYTPFTLVTLHGSTGWLLFSVIWGAAIIGMILNAIDLEKFSKISVVCYLAMGWAVVFAIRPLIAALATPGLILLVCGGVAYSCLLYTSGCLLDLYRNSVTENRVNLVSLKRTFFKDSACILRNFHRVPITFRQRIKAISSWCENLFS